MCETMDFGTLINLIITIKLIFSMKVMRFLSLKVGAKCEVIMSGAVYSKGVTPVSIKASCLRITTNYVNKILSWIISPRFRSSSFIVEITGIFV